MKSSQFLGSNNIVYAYLRLKHPTVTSPILLQLVLKCVPSPLRGWELIEKWKRFSGAIAVVRFFSTRHSLDAHSSVFHKTIRLSGGFVKASCTIPSAQNVQNIRWLEKRVPVENINAGGMNVKNVNRKRSPQKFPEFDYRRLWIVQTLQIFSIIKVRNKRKLSIFSGTFFTWVGFAAEKIVTIYSKRLYLV